MDLCELVFEKENGGSTKSLERKPKSKAIYDIKHETHNKQRGRES